MDERFRMIDTPARQRGEFARDVRIGLQATPKRLPCVYFYDSEGSALFEEICALDEYYLTRAEQEILERHAGDIVARTPPGTTLVELGSGSAVKTRLLIAALLLRQGTLRYVPVDVSRVALTESARDLLDRFGALSITAIGGDYQAGVARLAAVTAPPRLCVWLGSNVGNFHRPEAAVFLAGVRAALGPGDRVLMGVDLRKHRDTLERAYDDARGVTARFNLNLLARINRELGGTFDLAAFRHRAVYQEAPGRVEMSLVSTREQTVELAALELTLRFAAGEGIHTESSYKYSSDEIDALAAAAGLRVEERWLDEAGRFADVLLAPL
jgi:dimethylhistidine N-methyltransferase